MKKFAGLAVIGALMLGVSGCSALEGEVSEKDVYPILCPATEAAYHGNKLQKKVINKTVEEVEKNVTDKGTKEFLKYAKAFSSEDDNKVTKEAKSYVKKKCSANGIKVKF